MFFNKWRDSVFFFFNKRGPLNLKSQLFFIFTMKEKLVMVFFFFYNSRNDFKQSFEIKFFTKSSDSRANSGSRASLSICPVVTNRLWLACVDKNLRTGTKVQSLIVPPSYTMELSPGLQSAWYGSRAAAVTIVYYIHGGGFVIGSCQK